MPLDRTWLNAQVDDSGSGTDGSILDKADFTAIYDAIDVALGTATPGITTDGTKVQQIAFTATQSASANANTLDDYEEGTWTPVLGGSGGTSGQVYATQSGQYIKIGQLVLATFNITLSTEGTITGNCQIQGLPFTSAATVSAATGITWDALATSKVYVSIEVQAGTTVANVLAIGAAATSSYTSLTAADIGNTTTLRGTLMYRAVA